MEVELGKYTFSSKFCSGNCARVEQVGKGKFHVWTQPDCAGEEWETSYTTWFYFSVQGAAADEVLTFTIANMNKQTGLYAHDMRPVTRAVPSRPKWQRVAFPTEHGVEDGEFRLKFKHRVAADGDVLYFAFCYPMSYADLQKRLQRLDMRFARHMCELVQSSSPGAEEEALEASSGDVDGGDGQSFSARLQRAQETSNIYYLRELAISTLDGRRMDMLTISSLDGVEEAREPLLDGLFPDQRPETRAHTFGAKPYVLLTARVHPGETPASWSFDGALSFLLDEKDPRAAALRHRFVFVLVPMLNPDGVARGHYRADTRGVNLNRCYAEPSLVESPTVFAARALAVHCARAEGPGLSLYLDMHAHASKRGCFLYGNHLADAGEQVENLLFARLAAVNTPHFDFGGSVFSEKNMHAKDRRDKGVSKEGSGRVALYRATSAVRCYTLECNYNTGRTVNRVPDADYAGGVPLSPGRAPTIVPKYTPETWQEVGRALLVALLDAEGANPCSRLSRSNLRTLAGARTAMERKLKGDSAYRSQIRELERARTRAEPTPAPAQRAQGAQAPRRRRKPAPQQAGKERGGDSRPASAASAQSPRSKRSGSGRTAASSASTASSSTSGPATGATGRQGNSAAAKLPRRRVQQPQQQQHPRPPRPPPPSVVLDPTMCAGAAGGQGGAGARTAGVPPVGRPLSAEERRALPDPRPAEHNQFLPRHEPRGDVFGGRVPSLEARGGVVGAAAAGPPSLSPVTFPAPPRPRVYGSVLAQRVAARGSGRDASFGPDAHGLQVEGSDAVLRRPGVRGGPRPGVRRKPSSGAVPAGGGGTRSRIPVRRAYRGGE